MFTLSGVRYRNILHIDHLEIPEWAVTCIVGESGSGKTTLLKLLNHLISCDEGKILFNGSRLVDGMNSKKHMIEAALMLGVTPKMASKEIVNNSFDSAIMPTINTMVGMGIVALPGMMTGQILSGISPLVAIEYQIAIMLGIIGGVSLTVILFLQLGYKTFFNERCQMEY